ncbi:hypothetical protein L1O03_08370 [Corynebacterium uropygiale]|uniref:Uncharacterized protein n=1 Tax=Corynebacterium uropygiale TaxID=1775911 RepID=A0A9X1QR13_9CORY|nr:hypothetical protein [Corynebacterium uropygiale]MCF4007186.1 hypothetical protein [Corynebacterium uropygiale]
MMVCNDFDPRKIEIMLPGSNPVLDKNTQARLARFENYRDEGRTVPDFQVAWTSEDLSLVVRTCEYLRDHLPASAFRLETIPGFQIFPEPDCLAIGATGPVCGSYYAIRPGPVGLFGAHELSDWEEEVVGSGAYSRFEDALKEIVFDWLLSIGRVLDCDVLSSGMCPGGLDMQPYNWNVHKSLYKPEQQRYLEETSLAFIDSRGLPRTRENINKYITHDWTIFRSTVNDDAWFIGYDAPYFKNLAHGLNVDIFTFMDKVAVAIAERKKER